MPNNEKPSTFYCEPCPKCGKIGIPRGRGETAHCWCIEHGKYKATFGEPKTKAINNAFEKKKKEKNNAFKDR